MMIEIDESQINAESIVGVFKFDSPVAKTLRKDFAEHVINLAGASKKHSVILAQTNTGYIVMLSKTTLNRICAKINKIKGIDDN